MVIGEALSASEARQTALSFPHNALEMFVVSSIGRVIHKTQALIRNPVSHKSDEQHLPMAFLKENDRNTYDHHGNNQWH